MVRANVAGTNSLPFLLIGKTKKPGCFKNVTYLPVIYTVQRSAWMNSNLFLQWYIDDYISSVKQLRKDNNKIGRFYSFWIFFGSNIK